ncbi:terminase family protein [Neomegalonema sp.]|uniref:terminase large subunit domain-containing protein n=1 Tax=Neomegalonema sp. TaxID=2039713 RepID=UPI00260B2520|nr:terminase family protein [Neomegalonema sp.]MDD2869656.1 terminase family protein [Neomegalonema sp.]
MSSNKEVIFEATKKQAEFIEAVFSGKYKYLLFGGAIRSGKTFTGLGIIFILSRMFPGSRWAVVRRDLPVLRQNVYPTYNKIKPDFAGEMNQSTWTSRCKNGSEIIFFPESYDKDKDLNRFRGLEVNGFLLEEANELQEVTFYKCIERAGAWQIKKGEQPPPLIIMTCNPSDNWVKRIFYDNYIKDMLKEPYYFLPATILDNPHITEDYKESLKSLPPREYKRFVEGDWTLSEDPDQLIPYNWVKDAIDREPGTAKGHKRKLGVDVARFGDDETVLASAFGWNLDLLEGHHGLSIDKVASLVTNKINEMPVDADQVRVDSVGMGGGVVDMLRKEGYNVREIISGAKAKVTDSKYKFKNLRSQMWWNVREQLREGNISLQVSNPKLIEDLTAVKYKMNADKMIEIESKDDIKKRIGRSTDYGDAVVYTYAEMDSGNYSNLFGSGQARDLFSITEYKREKY